MPYFPQEPASTQVEDVVAWLQRELRAVSSELNETIALELRLTGQEPKKPREGMIVAADGTNWNPGGGKGIYAYLTGAWVKL
jgi:hypothetical protein